MPRARGHRIPSVVAVLLGATLGLACSRTGTGSDGGDPGEPSEPAVTLSGTVSGAAVEGVQIDLRGAVGGMISTALSTRTDATGRYSLAVKPGNYSVVPSLEGYVFDPPEWYDVVTRGASPVVNFEAIEGGFEIGGTISGTVSAGVAVKLYGPKWGSTVTDALGRYRFAGRPPGQYGVEPSAAGQMFAPSLAQITIGRADVVADFTASTLAARLTQSASVMGFGSGNELVTAPPSRWTLTLTSPQTVELSWPTCSDGSAALATGTIQSVTDTEDDFQVALTCGARTFRGKLEVHAMGRVALSMSYADLPECSSPKCWGSFQVYSLKYTGAVIPGPSPVSTSATYRQVWGWGQSTPTEIPSTLTVGSLAPGLVTLSWPKCDPGSGETIAVIEAVLEGWRSYEVGSPCGHTGHLQIYGVGSLTLNATSAGAGWTFVGAVLDAPSPSTRSWTCQPLSGETIALPSALPEAFTMTTSSDGSLGLDWPTCADGTGHTMGVLTTRFAGSDHYELFLSCGTWSRSGNARVDPDGRLELSIVDPLSSPATFQCAGTK